MLGTFDGGHPKVVIEVMGAGGSSRKMEAIIDTGYNGYLQIPLSEAFPAGLVLVGIQKNAIADGSQMSVLVCEGTVCLDGVSVKAAIDVHLYSPILVGTSLLKELNKTFVLDCKSGKVELH